MAFVLRRLVPLVLLALFWAPAAYAWSWPVQGPVLQQFSFDPAHPYAAGQHRGIDVGAPAGSAVVAPTGGTITFAGNVPASGTSLTILTADGYSVTLTHLGTIAVGRGAAVAEGDAVGTVGPSGTPDFDVPYVHLGIRTASDPNGYLDPLTLLPPLAPPATPDSSGTPAGSSAPPAETTPAPTVTAPEAPAPAPVVSVPSSVPAVRVPAVPRARPVTAAPAVRPTASKPTVQRSRPATVDARVRTRQPAAIEGSAGLAHAGWQPQPAAEKPNPTPLRHRPVPAFASSRERPGIGEVRSPVVPLAFGAGAATLAIVLLGLLRLRRRPVSPPEVGGVVIPLPRRSERLEERRVA